MPEKDDAPPPGRSNPRYISSRRETRKHYRVRKAAAQSLAFHVVAAAGKGFEGECLDLSIGGAGARFINERDPRLTIGAKIRVRIQHASRPKGIEATAEVASIQRDNTCVRYGVRFTSAAEIVMQIDGFYSRFFNRRRHVRVLPDLAVKMPGRIRWSDGEIESRVHDISMGGVGIMVTPEQAAKLKGQTRIELGLILPGTNEEIICRARIAASKAFSKSVLLGLEFEESGGIERYTLLLNRYIDARMESIQQWNNAIQQVRKTS